MKKKVLVALATLALAAIAVPASPASAKPVKAGQVNPAQYCRDAYGPYQDRMSGETSNAYVLQVAFSFGGRNVVEPFPVGSFAACVSTVAGSLVDGAVPASAISTPAYLARCDELEAMGAVTYPYAFYGVYPAQNRADCVRILKGVHSGQLPIPGPAPID